MQLDRTERIDKLDETLGNVEADYARLLNACDSRVLKDATHVSDTTASAVPVVSNTSASNGKRPTPDDENDEEAAEAEVPRPVKKIKFV